jgi:hypothetical protein
MVERSEPHFVIFNPGDVVEGTLVEIERIQVKGKPGLRYTLDDHGQLYRFLGTYQINEKLQMGDIGKWVRVRYEGENRSVERAGNRMRIFRVFVCQGRSKTRPVWRSKSRPVDGCVDVVELRGRRGAGA